MRKIFGWILILIGIFWIFGFFLQISISNIDIMALLPISILMVYSFGYGGYHLLNTKKNDDPIPGWKKVIVYTGVVIACALIGSIISAVGFDGEQSVMNWLTCIFIIGSIQSNILKKWMLKQEYKKHTELSASEITIDKLKETNVTVENNIRTCPNCGKNIEQEDSVFCKFCGTSLK